MWTWRRLSLKPQLGAADDVQTAGLILQLGSFGAVLNAHEVQAELPGSVAQIDVPSGGWKLLSSQLTPMPPIVRTSTSESSSSVKTTMRTSESGRRKSARCCKIVVSRPLHDA